MFTKHPTGSVEKRTTLFYLRFYTILFCVSGYLFSRKKLNCQIFPIQENRAVIFETHSIFYDKEMVKSVIPLLE